MAPLIDTVLSLQPISSSCVGFACVDRELRYLQIDETLASIDGHPVEAYLGRSVAEMNPTLAPALVPLLQQVLKTSEPIVDQAIVGDTLVAPGQPRRWQISCYPLQTRGGYLVGVDITICELFERVGSAFHPFTSQRVEAIFSKLPMGVVIFSGSDLRVRWANESCHSFFSLNVQAPELVGLHFHELLSPTVASDMEAIFHQVLASGLPYVVPAYWQHRDDEHCICWHWMLFPIALPEVEKPDLLFVVSDITAEVHVRFQSEAQTQQLKAALRASEDRFAKVFHASPLAMVMSTLAEGRLLDVNERFLELFGHDRHATIGQTSLLLDAWVNPGQRDSLIADLQQSGQLRDRAVKIRARDGVIHDVLLSVEQLEHEEERCILTTICDVTDCKQTEAELRQVQDFSNAILDIVGTLVVVLDRSGRIVRWNRACTLLTGYTEAEILGQDIGVLLSPEEQHDVYSVFHALRNGTTRLDFENYWVTKDGERRRIAWSNTVLSGTDGTVWYVIGTGIDITEQKQLEDQLLQAQKMESIGRLAGGIAHDFNNLLTAISGYVEIMLEDLPTSAPIRVDLYEIRRAVDRATMLTQQLLTFARRQPMAPHVINLNLRLAELEPMLRRLIGEDIDLVMHLTPTLGNVRADPTQLEQVVLNLVINACDAMPNGGQLILETSNVTIESPDLRNQLNLPPGVYVRLIVRDTGMGMAPEVQAHAFEPFFTTKPLGQGSGLGLSTSFGIIQQHSGAIQIFSEVERGTEVYVYLPLVEAERDEVPNTELYLDVEQGHETILIAEDEPTVRMLAGRILRACGYTVLEVADGIEAVQVAQQYAPAAIDLLLADVVMPQLSGPAAATQIAQFYPQLKVLLMSGYTGEEAAEHGCFELPLLQKPFTPALLARMVRSVIDTL